MSRALLERALSKLLVLSNTDIRNQETDELIEEIERLLSKPLPEPVTHQFRDTDGSWHDFINPDHYKNTVKDGR
jgi:hypothetical protein